MNHLLNHTQSYGFDWGKAVNDYTYQKRNLEWGNNPKPHFITDRMVKDNDKTFNPILQVYSNKNKEDFLRKQEKTDLITTIAKNQDNELKKEQTFNIINLQDRLKGFEKDPNYPRPKELINKRKNLIPQNVDYNIISCIPLSQHHYDKPENRPRTENSAPQGRRGRYHGQGGRDYDIISTRYKQFHNEKTAVDKEINKIQTAKLFYKKNDYNPIKGIYVDERKENDFQKKREEESKNWGKERFKNLPNCAKGQSDLYNLINMQAVNEEELKKVDEKNHNKTKRFEVKYKLENFYHDKSLRAQDKKNNYREQHYSYQRYKDEDARQYDIIDLKEKPYKEHAKNVKRDNITDWEKLVGGAGENNTFKSKTIYRDIYDTTAIGENYDKFQNSRKQKLNNLPKIGEDKMFSERVPQKCKLADLKEKSKREKMVEWDKERFFKGQKNVFYNEDKVKKISRNMEMNKRGEAVSETREKNMRNTLYTKDNIKRLENN